ncbi:transmembrane domain-containing protein [Cryptosporidium canis]|uniref:Transmembrane domain-containing protein n=1 Tax=Cryptosporidium canis TaxID=195482 RepID=A0ABQ8P487_9CRYT|nr:transmembrane domain-containing protein [Cryptosporidium canis]KAJ1607707.1 transmembrane domain-containing protein [Cryptosporidium canis]
MMGAVFNTSWARGKKDGSPKQTAGADKTVSFNECSAEETKEKLESGDFNNLSIDIPSAGDQNPKEDRQLSGMCKSEMNVGFQKGVQMIRKVRQKLRKSQNRQEKERDISLLWVFQNLSPHIPMFTIHPKNEVTILVDAERGLYIAGYFPISEVLRYTKQTGARLALNDEDPDCLLSENNLKSTILSPGDAAISGLIPFSSSFSTSSIVRASQYPLNRSQDNRYLESVEVRVVDRYRRDSPCSKEDLEDGDMQDSGIYYPELEVKNWVHSDGLHAAEALIFIHGYNNTIMDALRQVGQMIAFGNFPSYIKPMVFSWPSGNSFLEYFKARKSAESPHTHDSLYQLILGLRNRGIRHIHIMTHSMGTRLFIQSFPKLLLENLLERCEQHDHRSSIDPGSYLGVRHSGTQFAEDISPMVNEKVQIVSMTFLNPDYYLDDFINKAFPMLRQYCNLITMYGDSQDGALKWSEIIQGRKALGCNVFGLHQGAAGSFENIVKSQINNLDQYRGSDVELTGGLQKGVSASNLDAHGSGTNVSCGQRGPGQGPRTDEENHPGCENTGGPDEQLQRLPEPETALPEGQQLWDPGHLQSIRKQVLAGAETQLLGHGCDRPEFHRAKRRDDATQQLEPE